MTKISEFMIRVTLTTPIEVPDDQVAELCNGMAYTIDCCSDLDWAIRDHTKKFAGNDHYPVDKIIVWSNQEKYEQD